MENRTAKRPAAMPRDLVESAGCAGRRFLVCGLCHTSHEDDGVVCTVCGQPLDGVDAVTE